MIIKFLQSPPAGEQRSSPHSLPACNLKDREEDSSAREVRSQRDCDNCVVAHLDENEFALAKFAIPEIRAFQDYDDWLDFREAALFALRMAGFNVKIIPVQIAAFANWRRWTSTSPSLSALDRFAREGQRRSDRENLHWSAQYAK